MNLLTLEQTKNLNEIIQTKIITLEQELFLFNNDLIDLIPLRKPTPSSQTTFLLKIKGSKTPGYSVLIEGVSTDKRGIKKMFDYKIPEKNEKSNSSQKYDKNLEFNFDFSYNDDRKIENKDNFEEKIPIYKNMMKMEIIAEDNHLFKKITEVKCEWFKKKIKENIENTLKIFEDLKRKGEIKLEQFPLAACDYDKETWFPHLKINGDDKIDWFMSRLETKFIKENNEINKDTKKIVKTFPSTIRVKFYDPEKISKYSSKYCKFYKVDVENEIIKEFDIKKIEGKNNYHNIRYMSIKPDRFWIIHNSNILAGLDILTTDIGFKKNENEFQRLLSDQEGYQIIKKRKRTDSDEKGNDKKKRKRD